jgi:transitional endoplasmic reticulum ATPase
VGAPPTGSLAGPDGCPAATEVVLLADLLSLAVERSSREYAASTAGLAYIDPAVLQEQGLAPGDLLRLVTYVGRSALVRAAAAPEGDRGRGTIRLDRFQRQGLRARLGEALTVHREAEQPLQKLVLRPSVDMTTAVTHHLEEHLHETLVAERAPASPGMILFARFHHSVGGTTYLVHAAVPGPGVVVADTQVLLEPSPAGPGEDISLDVTFEDVGGLAAHIATVREMVQLPLTQPAIYRQLGIQPPRGLIFYGPPGTGKTHLTRAVASELNASFYYINGPAIVGSMYGETEGNLRKVFSEASHHAPSVILIDELDVLAPKRGETGAHSDTRVVTQLLSMMDGLERVEGVVVVATTNRIHAIDEALRRPGRFDRELYFGPPDEAGRREILAIQTRDMPLDEGARNFLPRLAELTAGYVGADLRELCREAGMQALRRVTTGHGEAWGGLRLMPDDIHVERGDFLTALERVRPSSARLVLTRSVSHTFADVGGLGPQKARLEYLLVEPLQDPALRAELGPGGMEGVLLYGPSGAGKTLLASAVAGECGANLVVVDGPELFTKWLGQTEESVRQVFELARRLAPSVLFFDQLDALAPPRSLESGSRTTERVISQIIAELDDLRERPAAVAVLAATNRRDLVDPAVLRPGRFGAQVEVGLPDEAARRDILAIELGRLGVPRGPEVDAALARLARCTPGASGAELAGLCREAMRRRRREQRGREQSGPGGDARGDPTAAGDGAGAGVVLGDRDGAGEGIGAAAASYLRLLEALCAETGRVVGEDGLPPRPRDSGPH